MRPRLATFPSDDQTFATLVAGLVARCPRPEDLARLVRPHYAKVVVRRRDISGDPDTWYVFRDGTWRPPIRVGGPFPS